MRRVYLHTRAFLTRTVGPHGTAGRGHRQFPGLSDCNGNQREQLITHIEAGFKSSNPSCNPTRRNRPKSVNTDEHNRGKRGKSRGRSGKIELWREIGRLKLSISASACARILPYCNCVPRLLPLLRNNQRPLCKISPHVNNRFRPVSDGVRNHRRGFRVRLWQ